MKKRQTAREIELKAAATPPSPPARPRPLTGEAVAMLARRGLQTRPAPRDLPFPADLADEAADRLSDHLRHYAFRLFLRGAIQKASGFTPEEATRYLSAAQARALAEAFVRLGLAVEVPEGRYRLHQPARSFGGTLESLLYLELKSSPPKHLSATEVAAFVDRVRALPIEAGTVPNRPGPFGPSKTSLHVCILFRRWTNPLSWKGLLEGNALEVGTASGAVGLLEVGFDGIEPCL